MDIIAQLKRDEGYNPKPYKDSLGKLTIGYGTLIENGLDQEECEWLLRHRYEIRAKVPVAQQLPWTQDLNDARLGAVENLAYNMGIYGLLTFKNMLGCLQSGDYQGAHDHLLDSKYATQVGARSHRLAIQILTGEWQ
jgi:lysozyme